MTANALDLTTLATLKTYINVGSNSDVLLQRLLTAASFAIEQYANRDFVSLSYNKQFDGNDASYMLLLDYPITAVAGVTINGQVIPAATSVTGNGYRFTQDTLILNGYCFARGRGNVMVNYTAGYSIIPYDIEQACIGTVQYWLNDRQRGGEVSRSMGGQTITYSQKDMPDWVKTILNQYSKRMVV